VYLFVLALVFIRGLQISIPIAENSKAAVRE